MSNWGKLFVLEGPDGVGKSTLTRILTEHLNSTGVPCDYFSFPGREIGTLGRHVYDFHHNPEQFGVESIHPTSMQVLHIAAHVDAVERYILPTLKSGRSIVLDRFWWSTWVYGRVSGVNSRALEAMLDVEFAHWNTILPTAVFLLSRSSPIDRDMSITTWEKLSNAYSELANEQKRYYSVQIIVNDATITETLDQILEKITSLKDDQQTSLQFDITKKHLFISTNSMVLLNKDFAAKGNTKISRMTTPTIFTSLSPAEPSEVFDTYWRFAVKRQEIFFQRLEGEASPWTTDPVLAKYKFTNAYRASDRVSQYLIRYVIYQGDQSPEEVFFRIILFKVFNRIETWELLIKHIGELRYSDYSFELYDRVLTAALEEKHTIFSAAYIMPSGGTSFGYARKHRNYLRLLESMLADETPLRLMEMRSMRQAFELLRSYPMMGDFLAYQYVTDINYSLLTNFSEMDFVVPGPGAKDGIRKCFHSLGGLNEADIIRLMTERQEKEFSRLDLDFRSLWGRPLQLIDCQNLFCEVDKYARLVHPNVKGISDRKRIKQIYQGKSQAVEYWYPPKWGINHLIRKVNNNDKSV